MTVCTINHRVHDVIMFMSKGEAMSPNCSHQRANCSSPGWYMSMESHVGRAMAQVVFSRRPLTAESRLRARVNLCGMRGGRNCTGTGFPPSSSVFPCQYHPTVVLHTHISSGGWTICPLVAAVQRHSLIPSKSIMESQGGVIVTGESRRTRRKPVPVPQCPPQIPHGPTQARILASAVRGRQLSAWAMARPLLGAVSFDPYRTNFVRSSYWILGLNCCIRLLLKDYRKYW
jgi:hypothetical protein